MRRKHSCKTSRKRSAKRLKCKTKAIQHPKPDQRKTCPKHAKTMFKRHHQNMFEKTAKPKTQNTGKLCLKDMASQCVNHVTACKDKVQQDSEEHVWKNKEHFETIGLKDIKANHPKHVRQPFNTTNRSKPPQSKTCENMQQQIWKNIIQRLKTQER